MEVAAPPAAPDESPRDHTGRPDQSDIDLVLARAEGFDNAATMTALATVMTELRRAFPRPVLDGLVLDAAARQREYNRDGPHVLRVCRSHRRGDAMRYAVPRDALPRFDVGPAGSFARILNGEQHELPSVSLMLAELQPGEGPAWHRHAYDEVFSIAEGTATFTIDQETIVADYGQIVLVPATVPHRFVNSGAGILKLTAVHVAPKVVIEWLE